MTITVVGLGLRPADQATPEAVRAIEAADHVLLLDAGIATLRWLEPLNPNVTDLLHAYHAEQPRLSTYHFVAARVLHAALEHRDVVFATEGHPVVGMHTTALVRLAARCLEIEVRILPGVSSIAALFAALAIDPMVAGVQAFEATDTLLRRRPIAADVPLLLWQVGNVETRLHSTGQSRPERFARLVAHLSQFYPDNHPTVLFHAAIHPAMGDQTVMIQLRDLPSHAGAIHPGHTLFVPPVRIRAIEDQRLAQLVDDPRHLEAITEAKKAD